MKLKDGTERLLLLTFTVFSQYQPC